MLRQLKFEEREEQKKQEKPGIQLHTTQISNNQKKSIRNNDILDSGALNRFFGNRDVVVGAIDDVDGILECVFGSMKMIGKEKVKIEAEESNILIENELFGPKLSANLLCLINLEDKGVTYSFKKGN